MAGEQAAMEYNTTHQTKQFKVGDMVCLVENAIRKRFNRKLLQRTQRNPLQITEVCSRQSYKVKNLRTGYISPEPVNGGQLLPYYERRTEKGNQREDSSLKQ